MSWIKYLPGDQMLSVPYMHVNSDVIDEMCVCEVIYMLILYLYVIYTFLCWLCSVLHLQWEQPGGDDCHFSSSGHHSAHSGGVCLDWEVSLGCDLHIFSCCHIPEGPWWPWHVGCHSVAAFESFVCCPGAANTASESVMSPLMLAAQIMQQLLKNAINTFSGNCKIKL